MPLFILTPTGRASVASDFKTDSPPTKVPTLEAIHDIEVIAEFQSIGSLTEERLRSRLKRNKSNLSTVGQLRNSLTRLYDRGFIVQR